MNLRSDHIIFSSAKDIAQICDPLKMLNITSFNFVRTYGNGSQINLCNIPAWLAHFYKNEFYNIGAFERHPNKYKTGYTLWPQLSGQKIFYDARTYFNIDNGITIIDKKDHYCEFYYFGTTQQNHSLINFYLNNLDLLQRFILYFKDQAIQIIKKAKNELIILPNHFKEHISPDACEEYFIMDHKKEEFIKSTEIKNMELTGDFLGEKITSKQFNCIKYLMKGYTAKETAKHLKLSFRTIEGHLTKLKIKFNCKTKSELIEKLSINGLQIYNKIF